MQKFLLSPLFWLPFILLLGIEFLFRLGIWEPLVKPNSHAGSVVRLKQTERMLPDDQVEWVTLGDSRVEIGFNHGTVLEQRLPETGHISLAVGGAHLATYHAAAEYARNKYPRLKGFVVGLAPGALQTSYNGAYEFRKIEPLVQFYGVQKNPYVPLRWDVLQEQTLPNASSLYSLREDLIDFAKNPLERFEQLAQKKPTERLYQPMGLVPDICVFSIHNLADCQRALSMPEQLQGNQKGTFETYCNSDFANKRMAEDYKSYSMGDEHMAQIAKPWRLFFQSLVDMDINVVVVLMPEHSVMMDQAYPENMNHLADTVVAGFDPKQFTLLDYRDIFLNAEKPECHYYHEMIHANISGAEKLTSRLLKDLSELR